MGSTTRKVAGALASVAVAAGLATPALAQATTHPSAMRTAESRAHNCSVKGLHPKVFSLTVSGGSCRQVRSLPGKLFRLDSRKGFSSRKFRRIDGWQCESGGRHEGGSCIRLKPAGAVLWSWV